MPGQLSNYANSLMHDVTFKPHETVWIGALDRIDYTRPIDPLTGRFNGGPLVLGVTEVATPGYRRIPYVFADDPEKVRDLIALFSPRPRGIGLYHDDTGGECLYAWE